MDLALFQENFEILRKSSGKWIDKQLVMMTAAQCAAKGKRINESDFKHVIDKVKKSSSAFSPLRTISFSIAGLIYTKTTHYDVEIDLYIITTRNLGTLASEFRFILIWLRR